MKHTKNNALADIEATDMLKDELYGGWSMTNDDTRNIAIRCVDRLVLEGYVKDCVDTNDTTEFSVQDIIHEEINKALEDKFCGNCGKSEYAHLNGVGATHCDRFVGDTKIYSEEDTCPKCDQHPYSETDRHCPVCFNEITKIAQLKAEIKDEKYYSKEMIKKLKAELSQGDK